MGEKIAPAKPSTELPRVKGRREGLEHGVPSVHAHKSDPTSDPMSDPVSDAATATSPTNGNAVEVPLTAEKAYYEQIIENAPEAISIVDLERHILRINGEFTRLFGFTAIEVAGKRLDLLIVPPDRYAETAWIAESMKTENKLSLETRRQRKDGSLVEVLLSSSPVTLNGKRVGTYASYRDITEQKRAEELNAALYAIAARSQSAEDLQQFFAAIHNIVGQLMNARNFYISLYDPQSQLLSFPYFVDEQDPTPVPKRLGRGLTEYVLRSGEPLLATPAVFDDLMRRGEVELIGASSLDWLGIPLKSGATCIGALVVQSYNENARFGERDREILKFVSQQLAAAIEHKRYEEALRRSEARSRSLILSAAFGICRCTLGGRFLDVNPALINMLGYGSVDELLHLDARREVFVNPQELDRLAEDNRRTGSLNGVEVQWKRKDARVITVRLSGCAATSTDEPEEVLELIAEDITDRRQLEEQLRQAQKMDAVGRLAGGVAHDFNNILMSIMGSADLLLMELESDAAARGEASEIKQSVERGAGLTRQLLAFSRRRPARAKLFALGEVVGGMETMLRRLIGPEIEFELVRQAQPTTVMADPAQIEQVVLNLVINARDAMPKGGHLTVRVDEVDIDETAAIALVEGRPGRYARLSVTDTGTGIDEQTRARLFEPFFTTKEKGKGTGLGLSIVYGIVKQSAGYVSVVSESGRGATFLIYLPAAMAPEAATAPA